MIKIYTDQQCAIEHMIKLEWHHDELYDYAVERAVMVLALKLAFWRKNPRICRMRFVKVLSSAWFEIAAFISYERGKFCTDFSERTFSQFGRSKVFMELDYDGLKSL